MPDRTTQQKQFTIIRVFDAPRETIWHAWTDPDEATRWWHPREVVTPRESVRIDLRVGGSYEYRMIAPDNSEYPTYGEYLEVVEPERLKFTWGNPGDLQAEAPVITVTLVQLADGKTEMTFLLEGIDGQPGDDNVYDGWDQAFDILVEQLA
ncbi:SRPBCC domain-containing protein [Salinibacterium sp. ZJ454]|uniref:SRPBCC family protein n=1 Tax=Salinibacterium sp. ZJ454 TaxID=2708339 RepID=UPI00141E301C|nr:SRPBCC domain-containing protein [Salinibacterium sp. ZJ454]